MVNSQYISILSKKNFAVPFIPQVGWNNSLFCHEIWKVGGINFQLRWNSYFEFWLSLAVPWRILLKSNYELARRVFSFCVIGGKRETKTSLRIRQVRLVNEHFIHGKVSNVHSLVMWTNHFFLKIVKRCPNSSNKDGQWNYQCYARNVLTQQNWRLHC